MSQKGEQLQPTAGQAVDARVLGPPLPPMDLTQLLAEPYTYNVYGKRERLAGILFRALEDDTEDDKSTAFGDFVGTPEGAVDVRTLEPFAKLALELKLAIASYCTDSPAALWALMGTCTIVRKRAEKHFWSFPNVFFLHDGELACLCRAAKICDPHVRKYVQQLVLPIDTPPDQPDHEALAWWRRLKRGFPALKKVWLVGRKPQVAPLLTAWKKREPGTEGIDVVTSSHFARPMVWDRSDGTYTIADPIALDWRVVHLPEPDPAFRAFRGSVGWIERMLINRKAGEKDLADREEELPTLHSPGHVVEQIIKIRDLKSALREVDSDIMGVRRLRGSWGVVGSAEWKDCERRFWDVLETDALRCADRAEDCRAAKRLKLEKADAEQQVHMTRFVASGLCDCVLVA